MANETFLNAQATALAADLTYIVYFDNYDVPANSDSIATKNELGRVAITSSTVSGSVITSTYTVPSGTANCLSTTVSSSTTASSFTLASISGLAAGSRISIAMGTGTVERKVMTLPGGNVVTINAPLTSAPGNGIVVKQLISQRAIITGGSGTANTGTIVDCTQFVLFKSSSTTGLSSLTHKIILS